MTDPIATAPTPFMHEAKTDFYDNVDGSVIRQSQEIPQDFLDSLKRKRLDTSSERSGEMLHAAAVPEIIHLEWLREGYDMTREPAHKTLARLRAKGLDAFIVTNKTI